MAEDLPVFDGPEEVSVGKVTGQPESSIPTSVAYCSNLGPVFRIRVGTDRDSTDSRTGDPTRMVLSTAGTLIEFSYFWSGRDDSLDIRGVDVRRRGESSVLADVGGQGLYSNGGIETRCQGGVGRYGVLVIGYTAAP
jgi:hypothetical protein